MKAAFPFVLAVLVMVLLIDNYNSLDYGRLNAQIRLERMGAHTLLLAALLVAAQKLERWLLK